MVATVVGDQGTGVEAPDCGCTHEYPGPVQADMGAHLRVAVGLDGPARANGQADGSPLGRQRAIRQGLYGGNQAENRKGDPAPYGRGHPSRMAPVGERSVRHLAEIDVGGAEVCHAMASPFACSLPIYLAHHNRAEKADPKPLSAEARLRGRCAAPGAPPLPSAERWPSPSRKEL